MPKQGIWRVYDIYPGSYYAELVRDGRVVKRENIDDHCKACAKIDLMAKTGIPADIRGWTWQGACGAFLKAMHISLLEEEE